MAEDKHPQLTLQEKRQSLCRAMIKSLPYIGSMLDQLIFVELEELRMNRMERTLNEIAAAMGSIEALPEEFANLLEQVTPDVARATNEDKRTRFRDLLINAASIPPEDPRWSDSYLVHELLRELDSPALAILAALHKAGKPSQLVAEPKPRLINGNAPALGGFEIGYDWVVVDEWMLRLMEKRLVHFERGGGTSHANVRLSSLGTLLTEWAIRDESPPARTS